MNDRLHGCSGCKARWGGLSTAHCAACHRTFSGVSAFEKHKPGQCLHPSSVGLIILRKSGNQQIWGHENTRGFGWKREELPQ